MAAITSKISPCLWFTHDAEDAARFYTAVFPDSRIDRVQKSPVDYPGGKAGGPLMVEFTLAGQRFLALNGGQPCDYTQALSLFVGCDDQAEVDRLWDGLLAQGGEPVACGWLRDRWGVSWQIVPTMLPRLLGDPDPARAARVMQAMMQMVKLDVAALERAAAG